MTREEEIRKQALKYGEPEYLLQTPNILGTQGFIHGAKWADKTMIEKACEWLNKTLYIHTEINDTHCGADTIDWVTSNYNSVSDFINDFKKEMEGKNG